MSIDDKFQKKGLLDAIDDKMIELATKVLHPKPGKYSTATRNMYLASSALLVGSTVVANNDGSSLGTYLGVALAVPCGLFAVSEHLIKGYYEAGDPVYKKVEKNNKIARRLFAPFMMGCGALAFINSIPGIVSGDRTDYWIGLVSAGVLSFVKAEYCRAANARNLAKTED